MVLKRVGITGATGMLGRHLVELFLQDGNEVIATSRLAPEKEASKAKWFEWDLSQWKTQEELGESFGFVDAIVHAGAWVPKKGGIVLENAVYDTNVRATFCLARFALSRNIPFVFISGSTVYRNPYASKIKETAPALSQSSKLDYAFSKLSAENMLKPLTSDGLKLTVVRPSSIYGKGLSYDKMLPHFLILSAQGQVIEIENPADDRINLIHASDVAIAVRDILKNDIYGTFNLGGKINYTIQQCAETCLRVTGRGTIQIKNASKSRNANIRFDLDSSQALKQFGFDPKITLLEGLEDMWNDMKSKYTIYKEALLHD